MLNLIIVEMLTGHLTLAACQLHPIWAPQLRLRALTHPLQATNYNREFCLVVFIMYMWRGGHLEANHSTTNQIYWALSLDFCSQMIWHWHASSKMAMPKHTIRFLLWNFPCIQFCSIHVLIPPGIKKSRVNLFIRWTKNRDDGSSRDI